MAAPRQPMKGRADELGGGCGRFDRDGVAFAVKHQGGNTLELREPGTEIEIAEAGPDILLGPAHDAERGELSGSGWIVEVRRDRQLEDPLLKRRGIPLAEPALTQHAALLLKDGIEVSPGERLLEPVACRAPRRGR